MNASVCRRLAWVMTVLPVIGSVGSRALAQETQEGPLPQLNRPGASAQSQADDPVAGQPATQSRIAAPGTQELSNDTVIRMTRAQVGDGIIIQAVRSQPGSYRTAPDDLIALKNAGVSEPVISAMLARNSGLAQRPDPKPIEVAPLSPEVDDPGVYFKNKQGQWEPVSPELVKYRDGGALKSLATNNIIKKDLNGEVSGPKSSLALSPGTEMMIVAPRLTDAVEYVILRFRPKSDRREFRVHTGNVFHGEDNTERDAIDIPIRKVQSKLFAFTIPSDLSKGEFGVLAPGTAAAPGIGHAGKIYTFRVTD